ncbi:hypothetical protein C5167_030749 [Papaver somniferum]|nr:hypothetical protein C5167_030749 [Papaver somniferum]
MGETDGSGGNGDLAGEMEVDAFRRLFPLRYYERHLLESVRPDARPLGTSRTTSVSLGAVSSADGSALVKIGSTIMLAAVKMEVMTPSSDSPDEGCLAIEFHMPPVCSPLVRPGRPAEPAPVISKQLSDVVLRQVRIESGVQENPITLDQGDYLSNPNLINNLNLEFWNDQFEGTILNQWKGSMDGLPGIAIVNADNYFRTFHGILRVQDIYCLDADGSLFDAALLSAVAALSSLCIPEVSVNNEGRVITLSAGNKDKKTVKEPLNKEKRKLTLSCIPFSLTCILHKKYILADPNSEEESIMETLVTVVLDSSNRLISLFKPGGPFLASTSVVQGCIALTKDRVKELQKILNEAITDMEVD